MVTCYFEKHFGRESSILSFADSALTSGQRTGPSRVDCNLCWIHRTECSWLLGSFHPLHGDRLEVPSRVLGPGPGLQSGARVSLPQRGCVLKPRVATRSGATLGRGGDGGTTP